MTKSAPTNESLPADLSGADPMPSGRLPPLPAALPPTSPTSPAPSAPTASPEERFLLRFLETWPEPVLLFDFATKNLLYANARVEAFLGYASSELVSAGFLRLFPPPKQDLYSVWLQNGPQANPDPVELELCDRHGAVVPVEVIHDSLSLPSGSYGILVLRSLSERKQIEAETAAIAIHLQERRRLESLNVLAGGIAHDFNNILTSILGYANFGFSRSFGDPKLASYFSEIEKATLRAGDLCRQILSYAGRGQLVIKPSDLNETILGFEVSLRGKLGPAAKLVCAYGADVPPVAFDNVKICQAIYSIVQNAADAVAENAGTIALRTYRSLDSDPLRWEGFTSPEILATECAVVEVADTGCGIPDEHLQRVFEPFFSTKFIGRGLGLSEAHGIVSSHHGAVQVTSKIGVGTTARIYLPTTPGLHEEPASLLPGWTVPPLPAKRGMALVADDMKANREYAASVLESMGYTVRQASDGMEMLQLFDQHVAEVALVLLDLTMPGLPSKQVLWRIKHSSHRHVRTVIMSGYPEEEALRRCSPVRPDAFLNKPFTIKTLKNVVHALATPA